MPDTENKPKAPSTAGAVMLIVILYAGMFVTVGWMAAMTYDAFGNAPAAIAVGVAGSAWIIYTFVKGHLADRAAARARTSAKAAGEEKAAAERVDAPNEPS